MSPQFANYESVANVPDLRSWASGGPPRAAAAPPGRRPLARRLRLLRHRGRGGDVGQGYLLTRLNIQVTF